MLARVLLIWHHKCARNLPHYNLTINLSYPFINPLCLHGSKRLMPIFVRISPNHPSLVQKKLLRPLPLLRHLKISSMSTFLKWKRKQGILRSIFLESIKYPRPSRPKPFLPFSPFLFLLQVLLSHMTACLIPLIMLSSI